MVGVMNRLDIQDLRKTLTLLEARAKKKLGQHFLIDPTALETIVESARLSGDDTVIEIGPGLGVLTERLLEESGRVVAFELDHVLAEYLAQEFPQLELIEGDAIKTLPVGAAQLDRFKIVANIPYQITTPLFKVTLESDLVTRLESLTLLIQKEVAQRLAAGPSEPGRGYLSVLVQYYADIAYVRTVPPTSFWPEPAVDSAVIHVKVRPETRYPLGTESQKFLRFVHTLFLNPRKQLKNVYAGTRGIPAEEVIRIFRSIGLPGNARAQELSLEQWCALYESQRNKEGYGA